MPTDERRKNRQGVLNGGYDRRRKDHFNWSDGSERTTAMLEFCYRLCVITTCVGLVLLGILLIL